MRRMNGPSILLGTLLAILAPRGAMAQLQTPDGARMHEKRPKMPEARHRQKIARRHFERPPLWVVARPPLRITRQSQYAWFGGGVWW